MEHPGWLKPILEDASRRMALEPEHLLSAELRALIAKRPRIERVEEIIAAIDWKLGELQKRRRALVKERAALLRKTR